ncbi:MAG TPA: MBL fold metallo-hydrolase, partial [Acidobacteriaceae bacterium]|nr:MBL fold metallo-hydrolase [Acidobacteriaceae bacterium]
DRSFPLTTPPGRLTLLSMFFRQYYLGCLAHASYLLGDEASHTAIVVDPQRDIAQYLADAEEHGFAIRHVFLTHFHADFIAGHLELRDRCGAMIHLGVRAQADYKFVAMRDGDTLSFPGLRLEVLETPGHTIESISLLAFDMARDAKHPWAVLTGDTLFIGDVGRPDLRASLGWSAADLGAHLYDSLHDKLLPLPDATLVYPAHGAGSLCGKNISSETVSSMGEQRRVNYALRPMTREQFVALVTADQPDAPAYFTYDAVLNTRERPTLDANLSHVMRPLPVEEFIGLRKDAQALDVRHPDAFARGHLRDAINIGLDGQFASWAGTILSPQRPSLLIAAPGREAEAALRRGRIGFDQVLGYLEHGMEALAEHPDLLAETDRRSPTDIAAELGMQMDSGGDGPKLHHAEVLDVRSPREYATKHIPGAVNIPLTRLREHLDKIPRERRIVLHCAGGYRSSIAASLLALHGVMDVIEMAGGLAAWEAAHLPLAAEVVPSAT